MSSNKVEKVVYFVRHGQSEDNILPVFQSTDPKLSDEGRRQAACLAGRASALDFNVLLTSPYPRAKETAELIGQAVGKVPEESALFVERVKPTELNGRQYSDEEALSLYRSWHESFHVSGLRVKDGENFADLVSRIDAGLELLQNRPEQAILVVTHGYFLRSLIARVVLGSELTPESFKQFQNVLVVENTGLTILRYEAAFDESPTWRLWIYNDHTHLGE